MNISLRIYGYIVGDTRSNRRKALLYAIECIGIEKVLHRLNILKQYAFNDIHSDIVFINEITSIKKFFK